MAPKLGGADVMLDNLPYSLVSGDYGPNYSPGDSSQAATPPTLDHGGTVKPGHLTATARRAKVC